jgi:hypothetical protein
VAAARGTAAVDFAVYYAGGKAGVDTTYVDEARVQAILIADHLPRSPRAPVPYGSPVLMATVFRPLAALPPGAAVAVYYAAFLLVLAATARRLSPDGTGFVLFGLVASGPFLRALTLGNWSVVTGCLLLLAYLDARAERRNRSSLWLAAAGLWKVYPVVVFVPFLVARAWRALAVAATVAAVAVGLTVAVLGPGPFVAAVRYALTVMRPDNPHAINLSLPGVAYRLTGDPTAASCLAIVLPLGVAAVLFRWRRAPLADLVAFAAVTMLLTGALTWDHYGTALFVFLPWLADQHLRPAARRAGIWLFAALMAPWFLLIAEEPASISAYLRFPYLPGALVLASFIGIVVQRKACAAAEVAA